MKLYVWRRHSSKPGFPRSKNFFHAERQDTSRFKKRSLFFSNERAHNFQSWERLVLVISLLIRIPVVHSSDLWRRSERYLLGCVVYERGLSGISNNPLFLQLCGSQLIFKQLIVSAITLSIYGQVR